MATQSDNTNTGVVATIVVVGAFAMISISALLYAMERSAEADLDAVRPMHADLDTIASLDQQQQAVLNAPAHWVDKDKHRVGVPISRAMKLVVEEYRKDPAAASPPIPPGLVLPPMPGAGGAAGSEPAAAGSAPGSAPTVPGSVPAVGGTPTPAPGSTTGAPGSASAPAPSAATPSAVAPPAVPAPTGGAKPAAAPPAGSAAPKTGAAAPATPAPVTPAPATPAPAKAASVPVSAAPAKPAPTNPAAAKPAPAPPAAPATGK
ncbi:MAG: hypothetical protein RL033_2906 [Pseudomonadota bacterium]|jgi:hypothetical protein